MYEDMNVVDNRLSLEDLSSLNPTLYDQIRCTAEGIAETVMHRLHLQAQAYGQSIINQGGHSSQLALGSNSLSGGVGVPNMLPILAPLGSSNPVVRPALSNQLQQQQLQLRNRHQQQQPVKKPPLVKAFIGGAGVTLNADRIVALYERVSETVLPNTLSENAVILNEGNVSLTEKLKYFLDTLQKPPPLPPVLLGESVSQSVSQ